MLPFYSSLFDTTEKNIVVPNVSEELENDNLTCDYNMETGLKEAQ